MSKLLEDINSPTDIHALTDKELNELSDEIRSFLIDKVSKTGGHLSSNLGVVELTLSLYKVFNFEEDKIVWDVGHQSYVHKILTGRKDRFDTLRKYKGLCGFPKITESKYDVFGTGHSSTSISAALGIARARDIKKENYNVIAVIGDGALTGGMALEALDDVGFNKTNMIIVLNDNQIRQNIKNLATGNNINNLSADFKNLYVPLPPLNIQQKIVDEIEDVEKKNNQQLLNITELKEKIKNICIVKSEHKKLEDFAVLLKRGKSPKYSLEQTDIKILKSGQIRGLKYFDLQNKYYASSNMIVDERLLEKDDLLINSTGVGTAGRVNIFNLNGQYFVDSHVTILRLDKSQLLPLFALYQLYYNVGFKNIEKMATGQSGQIELSIKTIANIKIPVPSLSEQQKIVAQIEKLEKQIAEAQVIIDNSKQQKQEILDKYLK